MFLLLPVNPTLMFLVTTYDKEALLKRWYNFDDSREFSNQAEHDDLPQILWETDSEASEGLLLESCSTSDEDDGILMSTPPHIDDNLLLATDSEDGNMVGEAPVAKRRKYAERSTSGTFGLEFLSKPVCRDAHSRLYGIGSSSMQRLRAGEHVYTMHQGRLSEPKHPTTGVSLRRNPTSMKWPNVLTFFWYLWISCAEILPVKFTMPCEASGSRQFYESSLTQDPEFQERYVKNFLACIERNYDRAPVLWRN